MALSRRLRFEILRRAGHTCRYCGAKAPDVPLAVDHVIPVALGGGAEPNNLVTACRDCNAGKSSTNPDSPLVEDVDAAALLFAKAMERAAEIQMSQAEALMEKVLHWHQLSWGRWTIERQVDGEKVQETLPLDPNWMESIERFLSAGLSVDDLDAMTDRAMHKKGLVNAEVFRYFCGCCWGLLSDRQELARRLIEDGEV